MNSQSNLEQLEYLESIARILREMKNDGVRYRIINSGMKGRRGHDYSQSLPASESFPMSQLFA